MATKILTAPDRHAIISMSELTEGAVLSSRRMRRGGDQRNGVFTRRASRVYREDRAVPFRTETTLGAFLCPASLNLKEATAMPEKWYLPQSRRESADCIENLRNIICYINDSVAFSNQGSNNEYCLSDHGAAGLCHVLGFVEDTLMRCNDVLLKKEA